MRMLVKPGVFVLLIVMSIIGLASAIVLLYEIDVLSTLPPLCTVPNSSIAGVPINCARVIFSPYGEVSGVPLEFLAAIWFIINILIVTIVSFSSVKISRISLKFLFGWRFIGILIVPYLIYLEFFVVKAVCLYCTIMHIMIIIDFTVISYLLFSKRSHLYINYEQQR